MGEVQRSHQLSDTVLEIGRKLHPRRYSRFSDLRDDLDACSWADTLDWRNNPYDKFLLRRELLHHLEATSFYEGWWNIYSYSSRAEIAAEVDRLLAEPPEKYQGMGIFHYVLVTLPWNLAFRCGRIRHNRLAEALTKLPSATKANE